MPSPARPIPFLSSGLLLGLLCLSPLLLPTLMTAAAQEPAAEAEHEHEAEGPLHDVMEQLKDNMRGLRRNLGSMESRPQAMEQAENIKNLVLEALPHCPPPAEGLSEVEQLKWRVDFERKMLAVADAMLQLQLALAEEDLQGAQDLYRTVGGIKKEGHDTYDPEEDED